MVKYDWHNAKRDSNIVKHGLDFVRAIDVYESTDKVTFKALYPSEERCVDIAPVDGRLMVLIYTVREDIIWIISYRKAKIPKEQKIYNKAKMEI